ncbi:sugar ABC transporter permease [Siminovitchia terrae]|uniref:carbohydrate ABC transporter permease n=1 Tax=Siminovitchia terrae TaxID=1914933 RepID=UPI001B0BD6D3|nr:carbohydrate ABC transporter permease [Siminovitchia terrae]GIN93764.1 sugar ABC transporter permease [Siminovitchia terrae]
MSIQKKILSGIGLMAVIIFFAFPFVWLVSSSLKTVVETLSVPPTLVPENFQWNNFVTAWESGPFFKYLINSILVTFGVLVLQIVTIVPAAYAFARHEFAGKKILWAITLITLMIPLQLIFLPVFLQLSSWGILDSLWGLILPFASGAFGIFMLRQTFMQVPNEILDAARLDKASELKIVWKIMMPLSKPTIITMLLFTFISRWNDYFWPLVMTTTENARTLPVGVAMLRTSETGVDWNIAMAANVILIIPILIVYFFAQKRIIQAFTYTGVK